MIKKGHLLKKLGFYKTINLLPSDGRSIKLNEFYAKLVISDHYNTFARIKFELLEKEIIEIDYNEKHIRYIRLTGNGVILKLRLKELIQQIKEGIKKWSY